MGCPCGGPNPLGCTCSSGGGNGGNAYSSGDSGFSRSYTSRTYETTSYGNGGGAGLYTTAMSQKGEMQGLNDRLAGFMQKIRDMCQSGAASVDPAKYREMMRLLECEIAKLRSMYEDELNKLRRQLQDCMQQAAGLANSANSNKGTIGDLQNRLQMANARAQKAEDDLNNLLRRLADKDKQIADLCATIKSLNVELEHLRPNGSRLAQENEELRRQLELERKLRAEAEAKAKALEDKVRFDGKAFAEQERDLGDRIRAANDIIQTLETKLKQLASDRDSNLPVMLQRLRDGTVSDMRKFQRETEDALNRNLNDIKKQMDDEAALRARLLREKNDCQELVRQLQAKCNALEGEIQGLKADNMALRRALDQEKARCAAHTRDLEGQLQNSKMQVITKIKDYNSARDAQASMKTEINQYRGLLDIGNDTMRNCPPAGTGISSARETTTVRESSNIHPICAMTDCCPPAYTQAQNMPAYTSRTSKYSDSQYGPVKRVTHTFTNPPGCNPGTDCGHGASTLPSINGGAGSRQFGTTYNTSFNTRKVTWT